MAYTQPRTLTQLRQEPPHKTVKEVLTALKDWEKIHNPVDRGGILNQFQFITETTTDSPVAKAFALVPFTSDIVKVREPIYLMPHSFDQLLERIKLQKDLATRLPANLFMLNVNTLIQGEQKERDVCLRLQDGNRARALVSGRYEAFDNLDLITLLEPFTEDAQVRWEYNDGLTFHLSVTFPKTARELRVGDVVEQGIHISNSEVALKSVTLAAYLLRLKCMNGMIGGGNDGSFFRVRHTGDHSRLSGIVKDAINSIKMEAEGLSARFKMALNTAIADPTGVVEKMARDGNLSQEAFKASLNALMGDPDAHTLFGVSNSFSAAAQNFDGEESFELQRMSAKALVEFAQKEVKNTQVDRFS
ncbi:MAG: DUF932 domain-containing protein [Chloroflexota bacterium]